MRRNFTQFFMGLALLVGFVSSSHAQCEIDPPPGAIYNFQFDGGPEGWRSLDATYNEDNLLWVWDETGSLKRGFYSTNYPDVIESESQCNGAMVMDSDFLDNQGMGPDFFDTGHCIPDCNGYLVSPPMDLSSAEEVELWFSQSVRQFQSEFYVYVSVDGGATNVDTFEINDDLVLNAAVSSRQIKLPLCSAGGESNVVVTFHYVANYYVWALDDISIVAAAPEVDMRVNRNFYAKVGNYETPKNMTHSAPVLVDIENLKAYDNPGSVVTFRASNEQGAELFSATREYGLVPGCSTDENKVFDDFFVMPTDVGTYSLEYEINSDGDINADNNVVSAPFKITDNSFRKLPTEEEVGESYLTGVRYGGTYISWGSYFYFPANEANQAIESVSLGIILSGTNSPSPGTITVGIYEWIDLNDNGGVDAGERELLGEGEPILIPPNSPSFQQFEVFPLDENGEKIVPAPDTEILVLAHTNPFDGNTNYFFNAVPSTGFEIYDQGASALAHRETNTKGGYGSFASGDNASDENKHTDRTFFNTDGFWTFDVSMQLSPATSTEEINNDIAVSVFPTPANNVINVDLSLEELSKNVSIEITDFAGARVALHNFNNIKKDRLTLDISNLTSGMYLVNVRTDEGMTSKKISVIQ